ncbi:MAG: glycoside hydrolase family 9 protein [Opitutales bacterium]|nr:glycoside hydrolase family 9 protein [Opitutales bacterium]
MSATELHSKGPQLIPERPGTQVLSVIAPDLLELRWVEQLLPPEKEKLESSNPAVLLTAFAEDSDLLQVTANGERLEVESYGFKRRVSYAALHEHDLRIASHIYLRLETELELGAQVGIRVRDSNDLAKGLRASSLRVDYDPFRLSPAIHVNHEGYLPKYPKQAMVGYYLGCLGEMEGAGLRDFKLIDLADDSIAYTGSLESRPDKGYNISPLPYQEVLQADFSAFKKPGRYRLMVPGLGVSQPFRIDEGIALNFTRLYALGLYHQRCGCANSLPHTRFVHDACHTAPATIPVTESDAFTWRIIAQESSSYADNPRHTAAQLNKMEAQLFPFVNDGPVDVQGGHHDAGDYSKYTLNSAAFIHTLIFAVDSLPGVAELDNLGIPESGDGVGDLLQIAKWELRFLARMQDADGGFYFLVYPKNRRYEHDVLPDEGDPQVVWPKNTAATAAASAALAQAASSPAFKANYPEAAERYLEQAIAGWEFLQAAIDQHGKDGAYQRITHYGDLFMHDDELAWLATELFLATGEESYHRQLLDWFDPSNSDTRRWGWWRLAESYGNAIRSYAFATRSGRLEPTRLNQSMLRASEDEIVAAGMDVLRRSDQNAYGTSFPVETKRVRGGGWYFSLDQAFDLVVAYQLDYPQSRDPRPEFLRAFIANLNFEAGTNPVNVPYLTGVGHYRANVIVHHYAQNDRRQLPLSGIPIGNIQAGLPHLPAYAESLSVHSYPLDSGEAGLYAYYNRWTDTHNVPTEPTIVNQARGLAGLAFLAARTELSEQAWHSAEAEIIGPENSSVAFGEMLNFRFKEPEGFDPNSAVVVWEAAGQEPTSGGTLEYVPQESGPQWVEVEAHWPDGRRVFAVFDFYVESEL